MRISYVLCFLMAVFAFPAAAAEADLKQEVQKIGAVYSENFNKQNAAGIAALYTTGAVHVNAEGPTTDIAKRYEGVFKAGFNHLDVTVADAWPVGADALVATGQYHLTGKNASGAPIEAEGIWTSTDIHEGGTWKIRMLTAVPKAPPPKD